MTAIDVRAASAPDVAPPPTLERADAEHYAEWFAVLADATRVRLLHTVSTSAGGAMRIGDLAAALGISQSTCSHHVELLKRVGFVVVDKVGTASLVSVNAACCTGLPHAADVVMGALSSRPCCPTDLPGDVTVRPVEDGDLDRVLAIYAEGLATRNATFETTVPTAEELRARWLPDLAWVAELDGEVVGWTAVMPTSARECYAGVGETAVYVAESARGPWCRQGPAPHPGQRRRRRGPVDPAGLGLPREPRQPGRAPRRRLPHVGGPHPDRPARRGVARHRAAGAAQRGLLRARPSRTRAHGSAG